MKRLVLFLLLLGGCATSPKIAEQPPVALEPIPTVVAEKKSTTIVTAKIEPQPTLVNIKTPASMPPQCAAGHCPRIIYPRHQVTGSSGCKCTDNCHCK